jgi:hydroxyacylglutathione hydrolase
MDVRTFTVGPVAENCFIFRREGSDTGLIVDPGEEADRLLGALDELGITNLEAILLTHTHFDHVGAVAPVARATGAPVYCPAIEVPILADIMSFVPWPGFGPFEVLFQGSVGRTDLPGADAATLMRSLATLVESFPEETTVYPGHMGITTLGAERASNPFLARV